MRHRIILKYSITALALVLAILIGTSAAVAQTSNFTYQGRLTDGGTTANGNYDLQFALFDSLSGGSQVGSTQTLNTVAVSNGVFTVSLDFGASAFNGASRFLEITARPSGGGSFTLLSPRQQITSTPYAVRSLNATSADTVPASGVPAGSGNYIQNSASPQAASNFNISGTGSAGTINANAQYTLNGLRILKSDGVANLFVGFNSGTVNTTGMSNTFVGSGAGFRNTTGSQNAYFGEIAGRFNTTGNLNSFFGDSSGSSNIDGSENAFFGQLSGFSNTTGKQNSFIGAETGGTNGVGSKNTLVGYAADVFADNLTNATAIGAFAHVDISNALVLGTSNTNVGIGTSAPTRLLHLKGLGSDGSGNGDLLVTGTGTVGAAVTLESTGAGGRKFSWISTVNSVISGGGTLAAFDSNAAAYRMVIDSTGRVGIGTTGPDQTLSVNGNASKASGGAWLVFSDERLKNIKGRFTPGLAAVMRLQPLRYEYKRDNALTLKSEGEHIGFSAQAVQKIIPEAVTADDKGYLLVNNDPILWTMLNAIKEQQSLIQAQQQQIAGLKKLVCRTHRRAAVCK